MSTIVTRVGKGSPLTWTEVDSNFTNLNTDKLQSGNTASSLTITSATINGGSINGTTVGASTASSGAFTTLSSNGATTFTAGTASTSTTTGTAVITGGLGVSGRINAANFDGIVGANTAAAGTFTSLSDSGNLTFTGTGNRITGDFINATLANRVLFQSSTTNSNTSIGAIPNGTSSTVNFRAYGASDPTNSSFIEMAIVGTTDARFTSNISGTGTYLPITFYTGGFERMRIDTSGNVGIGTTSPACTLTLNGTGVTGGQIQFQRSGTLQGNIYGTSSAFRIENTSSTPIVFLQNTGTEYMRITSAGDVGIGTSSPASFGGTNFQVQASSAATYASTLWVSGTYTMEALINQNAAVMSFGSRSNHHFALVTNDTERMRIDSSGNVGIGFSSGVGTYGQLEVGGSTNPTMALRSSSGSGVIFAMTSVGATEARINAISNVPMTFYTNNTERMRIDSSGNVGIGTSSPSKRLEVSSNDAQTDLMVSRASNGLGTILRWDNTAGHSYLYNNGAYPLLFGTNTTERMRITSGGEVYIAGTADQGAYNLQCNGTGVWGAGAYVNGSDARIKENIASINSGLDVVNKLNPVTYTYKEEWSKDQSIQTGFIAQELLVALEGKNYVDGIVQQGGSYMSVAYQNIIPILTKAIQEQQTIINDLTARITTLENK